MKLLKPIRGFTFALAGILLLVSQFLVFTLHQSKPKEVDTRHVYDVYRKIIINSGTYSVPQLIILRNDEIINAWTDGHTITFTTGILKFFDDDNELALVMGHELAHYMKHDVENEQIPSPALEHQADMMGAFMMMRAGFDICKGIDFFKKVKEYAGDSSYSVSHPSNAFRYDQLHLPLCGGNYQN